MSRMMLNTTSRQEKRCFAPVTLSGTLSGLLEPLCRCIAFSNSSVPGFQKKWDSGFLPPISPKGTNSSP
jgi:hypothetical protein